MNSSVLRRALLAVTATALMPVATGAVAHAAEPAVPATVPPLAVAMAPDGTGIDGSYIVTLRQGVDPQVYQASRTYSSVIRGFAAALDADRLEALRRNPEVVAIEQDRRWSLDEAEAEAEAAAEAEAEVAATTYTPTANWGLDRIDQRPLPLNNTFLAPSGGAAVRAYIMDTGTDPAHPDFGGRAQSVFDGFPGEPAYCEHHGTWTGGIVGSQRFGVAKDVLIRGMRVFDCDSETTTAILLSAMDFIGTQGIKPAVVNMSFGGPASDALDAGAKALWDNGFFVAASAGNDEDDTCGRSPARAVYAVAASNLNDRPAYFTSFGPCVDIYAPGTDITATAPAGGFHNGGGTSASAPFVAGAAALYKSMFGDAPSATIANWLNSNATTNVIQENEPGTPNRLLFIGPGLAPAPDGVYGYVYASSQSNPDYIPSINYQRNTTGALNRVTRSAVGTYRVHFPGLAGTGGLAHAAMANELGMGCQIGAEGSSGTEQFLDVRCFGTDGLPADGNFVAHYSRPAAGLSGAFGYVRAAVRVPGPGGPVFGAGTSYNSMGLMNTVTRLSAGSYRVEFPGLGVPGGTVEVNAVGPDPRVCHAPDWFPTGTVQTVLVSCRDVSGTPADSLFGVTFSNTRSILGTAAVRAHVWVPTLGPGTPTHTPSPIWAFASSGGPIKVTREGTGRYEVMLTGVASSTNGQAIASATGTTSARCRTFGWSNVGADEFVNVRCYTPAGVLVDNEFVMQFVW